MLAMLVADTPAVGRGDLAPEAVAAQSWRLARVHFSGRSYFFDCPSLTPQCRRTAYVVQGDLVLIGSVKGALVETAYTNPDGVPTTGWLLRNSVVPVATPRQSETSWFGEWSHDDTTIDIERGRRAGRLNARGEALSRTHDPDTVRRGVHVGEFEGEAALAGDRILFNAPGITGEGDCRVSLRLIGPYLVGDDNLNCGATNATFFGVYRRTSGALHLDRGG
jgi:hypothetical protein